MAESTREREARKKEIGPINAELAKLSKQVEKLSKKIGDSSSVDVVDRSPQRPVELSDRKLFTRGLINGRVIHRFVFDTMSDCNMMSTNMATKLGLPYK